MLRLAILRHAEAVPQGEIADRERPLTEAGRDMSERVGRYFRDEGLAPDLALVSPSLRTRETFESCGTAPDKTSKSNFRLPFTTPRSSASKICSPQHRKT